MRAAMALAIYLQQVIADLDLVEHVGRQDGSALPISLAGSLPHDQALELTDIALDLADVGLNVGEPSIEAVAPGELGKGPLLGEILAGTLR